MAVHSRATVTPELPTNVQVALRIRPRLSVEDVKGGDNGLAVQLVDDDATSVVCDRKEFGPYDFVFGPAATQKQVFEDTLQGLVEACMSGYNCTVFAYGQTGAGKSYTLGFLDQSSGSEQEEMGIVPRALALLMQAVSKKEKASLKAQFIEVHKERLRDLLASPSQNATPLQIQEETWGGTTVTGATDVALTSVEQAAQLIRLAISRRRTGKTSMNDHSSRSHCILTVTLEQTQPRQGPGRNASPGNPRRSMDGGVTMGDTELLCSKFHFVDLAGSERSSKTQAVGEAFQESCKINFGLLALGNVISALASQSQLENGLGDTMRSQGHGGHGDANKSKGSSRAKRSKTTHIPYRDSKLTRMLQDSLGGNAKTLMIACLGPEARHQEESFNTLTYAARARCITNKPVINRDPYSALISELRGEISMLRALIQLDAGVSMSHAGRIGQDTRVARLLEEGDVTRAVELLQAKCDAVESERQQLFLENARLRGGEEERDEPQGGRESGNTSDSSETSTDDSLVAPPPPSHLRMRDGPLRIEDAAAVKIQSMARGARDRRRAARLRRAKRSSEDSGRPRVHRQTSKLRMSVEAEASSPPGTTGQEGGAVRNVWEDSATNEKSLRQKTRLLEELLEAREEVDETRRAYQKRIEQLESTVQQYTRDKERLGREVETERLDAPLWKRKMNELEYTKARLPALCAWMWDANFEQQIEERLGRLTREMADLKSQLHDRDRLASFKTVADGRINALTLEVKALRDAKVEMQRDMSLELRKSRRDTQELLREVTRLKAEASKQERLVSRLSQRVEVSTAALSAPGRRGARTPLQDRGAYRGRSGSPALTRSMLELPPASAPMRRARPRSGTTGSSSSSAAAAGPGFVGRVYVEAAAMARETEGMSDNEFDEMLHKLRGPPKQKALWPDKGFQHPDKAFQRGTDRVRDDASPTSFSQSDYHEGPPESTNATSRGSDSYDPPGRGYRESHVGVSLHPRRETGTGRETDYSPTSSRSPVDASARRRGRNSKATKKRSPAKKAQTVGPTQAPCEAAGCDCKGMRTAWGTTGRCECGHPAMFHWQQQPAATTSTGAKGESEAEERNTNLATRRSKPPRPEQGNTPHRRVAPLPAEARAKVGGGTRSKGVKAQGFTVQNMNKAQLEVAVQEVTEKLARELSNPDRTVSFGEVREMRQRLSALKARLQSDVQALYASEYQRAKANGVEDSERATSATSSETASARYSTDGLGFGGHAHVNVSRGPHGKPPPPRRLPKVPNVTTKPRRYQTSGINRGLPKSKKAPKPSETNNAHAIYGKGGLLGGGGGGGGGSRPGMAAPLWPAPSHDTSDPGDSYFGHDGGVSLFF